MMRSRLIITKQMCDTGADPTTTRYFISTFLKSGVKFEIQLGLGLLGVNKIRGGTPPQTPISLLTLAH